MEGAPENGKESSNSALANGMNEMNVRIYANIRTTRLQSSVHPEIYNDTKLREYHL
jgi:hypothetical protein